MARTASSKPNVDYEAVKKLRQANEEKEKEEETKLALKDSVDSRLNAWKAGKETNIRALVASLDTVLWPELGWQKIGMHELVTPGQVKIRYMKAIAKLHPDKVRLHIGCYHFRGLTKFGTVEFRKYDFGTKDDCKRGIRRT